MDAIRYFDLLKARELLFIIDDRRWQGLLEQHGVPFVHFDDHDLSAPEQPPLFFWITQLEYHRKLMGQWKDATFISSHLALAKFDTSPECMSYSLAQFLSVDFADALARRIQYYDAMLAARDTCVVTAAGELRCRFRDEVEVANNDTQFQPGWLYSVAEFFESSIINLESEQSSFTLDGDLAFTGLIHLYNNPALREQAGPAVTEMQRLASAGRDNVVSFKDSRVTRLVVGGEDRTAVLHELTRGKERDVCATEFALGCVDFPQGEDWSFNCVLNESTLGAHVGVGMGREIPHIDFIAKGAELRFVAPEEA